MNSKSSWLAVLAMSVTSIAALTSCDKLTEPKSTSGLDSVTVKPADATWWADGVSTTRIQVQVDTTLPSARWVVTVNTTAGTFVPEGKSTVTLGTDSGGVATVFLRAPRDPGVAYITAYLGSQVGGMTLERSIIFQRAEPDGIAVIPKDLWIKSGTSLSVTVRLWRSVGRPSPGFRIAFADTAGPTPQPGVFSTALPTDASDSVTVIYSVKDTLYAGPITITASVQLSQKTLTDAVTITAIRAKLDSAPPRRVRPVSAPRATIGPAWPALLSPSPTARRQGRGKPDPIRAVSRADSP